jgi:TRAP-type C4-dicarboxylate transport system permease small subunit
MPVHPNAPPLVERLLDALVAGAGWLVLPVSLLLFLQWPLREVVQRFGSDANDWAQVLFAFYVSVGITAATRGDAHLAADAFARRRYTARGRHRWSRIAAVAVLVPWSLYLMVTAWPIVRQSVGQLESFPETYHFGYFLLKIALALMPLLVMAQALQQLARPPRIEDG